MRVVEHSSASVESRLSELEAAYSSFPVNQTTVTVKTERYERARANVEQFDLYGKVKNGDGEVLHLRTDNGLTLPNTTMTEMDSIEPTLVETIREMTGIKPDVDDIEQVTIVGITDEADTDRDTVYRLAVLASGTDECGTTDEHAVWKERIEGTVTVQV